MIQVVLLVCIAVIAGIFLVSLLDFMLYISSCLFNSLSCCIVKKQKNHYILGINKTTNEWEIKYF